MSQSLLDLLAPPGAAVSNRVYGVVVGIVTNNKDDEGLGRVRVRFPWLSGSDESWWARVATPMAGKERGVYCLPEVDDEVLVAFEHGDASAPYVIGSLWNGKDPPPETNDGNNNRRIIKSRSGHVIRLDDTKGGEKIEIIDKDGKNSIVISTADNTIAISADANITIMASGGTLKLSGASIELTAQAGVTVEAGGSMDLKADGQMRIRGATVDIN
jgi:uncharacterized protein involved in type VI secretion and phage assembly